MRPLTTVRAATGGGGRRGESAAKGNTARSADFPISKDPISESQLRARAPSIVSIRKASSPVKPAASASFQRSRSPTLITESVPRPTGTLDFKSSCSGAVPWRWAVFDRGQWTTAGPASRSSRTSAGPVCAAAAELRRNEPVQFSHRRLELEHPRVPPRRIGTKDPLVHDSPPAEVVERAHHCSRAARLRDARNAACPAVANTRDRCFVERL